MAEEVGTETGQHRKVEAPWFASTDIGAKTFQEVKSHEKK